MKHAVQNNQINLVFDLFKDVNADSFEYIYRGTFSQTITDSILSLTEINLNKVEDAGKIKKRVYFIMIECLQNITRHQDNTINTLPDESGLFVIQKKASNYYITTGNLISSDKVEKLQSQLDKINSLEPDELKSYYLATLDTGDLSEKGGAGLGLIEMSRRSGSKLAFAFRKVNDLYSFFYLTTEIHIKSKFHDNTCEVGRSLESIEKYHEILSAENILLNFKGAFNQENLLSLLAMIERQMKESVISIKAFNIMVEMLQNIVKHADNMGIEADGNLGIFLLSEKDHGFYLTAGNYIKNSHIAPLKSRLEYVNNLSMDDLDGYYVNMLLNMDVDDSNRAGLGIIDIRMKSEQKFEFRFLPVNDKYSFFSLQTHIEKIEKNSNALVVKATKDSPEIHLNEAKNIFEFRGRSIPQDAKTLYQPAIDWFEKYLEHPNTKTPITFEFDYLNTSSTKQVIKILMILEKIAAKSEVTIFWHYKKMDEVMSGLGLRYAKLLKLKFVYIEN